MKGKQVMQYEMVWMWLLMSNKINIALTWMLVLLF